MSPLRPVCLLLALLTGCDAPRPPATEASPFELPAGSPRNIRVGFVEAAPPDSRQFPFALIPGTIIREGYTVVSRDHDLRPTAVLTITQIQGHIALANLVRGRPRPKDEVVLPSTELTKTAEALLPASPGS